MTRGLHPMTSPRSPSVCFHLGLAVLVGCMTMQSAVARASDESAPDVRRLTERDPAERAVPGDAGSADGVRRERCLCSSERLVRGAKEIGDASPLAVVLDDGEGSSVLTFDAEFFTRGSSNLDAAPARVELVPFSADGLAPSKRRLARVIVTSDDDAPFFVGLVRAGENVPKDVVRVTPVGGATHEGRVQPAANLSTLFVGPDETRVPRGCGTSRTRAVAFTPAAGSAPLAGFVVDVLSADGRTARAFVDERHARSFGVGRVEACDHGAPLEADTRTLTFRPIGADLALGEPWVFDLTERVPTLVSGPDARDADVENPFTRALPGQGERFDDESDKAALGTMLGLVGAALVLASMLWPALRRRRTIVQVSCPACDAGLTLDLTDPHVDGGFCPRCGGASIFVSHRADGAPEARLFVLEKSSAGRRPNGQTGSTTGEGG